MTPAVNPELLCWQNYGQTMKERWGRNFIYFCYILFTMWMCFRAIFGFESKIQAAENLISSKGTGIQSCQENITAEMAFIDYKLDIKERSGDFDCYCDNIYHVDGYFAMVEHTFELDPEKAPRCHEWWH